MQLRAPSRRLAGLWRWMAQPWRSPGLALALLASFAAPALMAASADLFRESAADTISQQLLDESPGQLGVTVSTSGVITSATVNEIDTALGGRIDEVPLLGPPTRTISAKDVTLSEASAGPDVTAAIRSRGTLLQRAGAIEALEILDGDISVEGIWISERVAEEHGLTSGTDVTINDSAPIPIAGVYTNLWEGERDPYWNDVPPILVPTFVAAFGGPLVELYLVPESVMTALGTSGDIRWDAELTQLPATYQTLVGLSVLYRDIERSYTESASVAGAIATFGGPGAQVPTLRTGFFDVREQADRVVAELEQPIQTTAAAGIIIGLLITAAGAAFAVRKRDNEFRLLRSDGDPGWKFAARAVGQYAPFAIVGGAIGIVGSMLLVSVLGPGAPIDRGAIDTRQVIATAAVGLALTAFISSMAAIRILDETRRRSRGIHLIWLLPVVGLAIGGWIQAGAVSRRGAVDVLIVAFPVVGLIAGVGVVTLAAGAFMRRAHRLGRRLPTPLFLAWRRMAAAEASAGLLSAALGVALGLMIFSTVLVGSLEVAADAKTVTVVGGETSLRMVTRDEFELPDQTTIIKRETTRLTVGDAAVTVLVIDPDTFVDGVSWDPLFGATPIEVLDALNTPVDTADLAVVSVAGFPLPTQGGFGTSTVVSYEVVAELNSVPLASQTFPTLIVRSDHLEAAAIRFHQQSRLPDFDVEEWDSLYRSPTRRFANIVVSQLDAVVLTRYLDTRDLSYRDVVTISGQRDLVGKRATQWTFEYLWLLAVIAGLSGAGTLFFYLSERRTATQLSEAMTERMGLRASTARIAAVVEMLGLAIFALIAGSISALLLAGRVFARFEPDPRVPPDVGLHYSFPVLAGISIGAVLIIVTAALWSQRSTAKISYSEVLRGS